MIPTFVNVATPLVAATVAVPTIVAPELTVIVTAAVALTTVLTPASWTFTTGCVVNAAPLAAPAALVVSTSCVADPTAVVMVCVAGASPVDEKLSV